MMTRAYVRTGLWRLLAFAACAFGLAACASSSKLTNPKRWALAQERAEEAGCYPYMAQPFRRIDAVDVAIVGLVREVRFDDRRDRVRTGMMSLQVDRVLHGELDQIVTVIRFRYPEGGLGHAHGREPPTGRAVFYLNLDAESGLELVNQHICQAERPLRR